MNAEPDFATIYRQSPELQATSRRAHAAAVAERQGRLEAIAKLDAAAAKAYPRQEKAKADSLARHDDAERAFRFAIADHQKTLGAVAEERLAYDRARREQEEALTRGDWPELAEFLEICDREIDRAKAGRTIAIEVGKNRFSRVTNGKRIGARIGAIFATMREIGQLKMIADRRELPAALAKIRDSWPAVAEPRDEEARAP